MRIATLSLAGLVLAAALISSTPMRLSSFDSQVKELLARMTLDEKIGQMTQADKEYVKDPTDVETLFLGSILNGGNSDPDDGNSLEAWTNMYGNFQKHTLKTSLRIPRSE